MNGKQAKRIRKMAGTIPEDSEWHSGNYDYNMSVQPGNFRRVYSLVLQDSNHKKLYKLFKKAYKDTRKIDMSEIRRVARAIRSRYINR